MYINSYVFKAEVFKPEILKFIANVPGDLYFFLIPPMGLTIYGFFTCETLLEFFINEFAVKNFEIIRFDELRSLLEGSNSYSMWGNKELTNYFT